MVRLLTLILICSLSIALKAQYVFKITEHQDMHLDLQQGPVPKWSPDGNKLAFISNTKNKTKIIVKTSDTTLVIKGAQNDFRWSHDGTKIIYTVKVRSKKNKSRILQLFCYDFLSGRSFPLSSPDRSSFYPDILFNDSLVVYYGGDILSEPSQLYLCKMKGGTEEEFIHNPSFQYLHPKYSPTGINLFYTKSAAKSPLAGAHEVINVQKKKLIFSLDGEHYFFEDWSPDGTRILVTEYDDSTYPSKTRLMSIEIATGIKKVLSGDFKEVRSATWGEKSGKIIFFADNDIFLASDGSTSKITENANSPSWHPSEEKILFVKTESGFPIYEINIDGTGLNLVYNGKRK